MAKSISSLESHLGYWLRFVSNHVSHAFALKVESHGVTVAEWVVLRALFDADAIYSSEVADMIGMTRGAVSKLVERLSVKGLVVCRVGKSDRRYQTVTLSATGKWLVPKLVALADQNDREFFGHLSKQERENLFAVLMNIVHSQGINVVPVD